MLAAAILLTLTLGTFAVAQAAGRARSDPADAAGPLDLASAAFTQQDARMVLSIRTRGRWTTGEISTDRSRSLCLKLFGNRPGPARKAICVVGPGRSRRARLLLFRLAEDGRVRSTHLLARASVSRPSKHSLRASFEPGTAGLRPGRYSWQISSSWAGSPECPAPTGQAACVDFLPNQGLARVRVKKLRLAGCAPRRPGLRSRGPRRKRVVALTFDDGPGPDSPRVLRILRRSHVPGTFFLIGQEVRRHRALARRELAEGNMLANHTYTHANVAGGNRAQLSSTQRAIRAATGFTPCLFRPPGGAVSAALVTQALAMGMNTILWTVDPRDWATPGASAIYQRLVSGARPGAILLMHDGGGPRGQTVAALPRVIHTLRRRGYRFVTLDQLLRLRRRYR